MYFESYKKLFRTYEKFFKTSTETLTPVKKINAHKVAVIF